MDSSDDLISRTVQVLDEMSPYMSHNRVLKSRVPKKRPRQRFVKRPKITGERELADRAKESQRKQVKDLHPNTPLKWDGHKWKSHQSKKEQIEKWVEHQIDIRQSEFDEMVKNYQLHAVDGRFVFLGEITLRTGAIVGFLAKVKQYANKVDQGVAKMRSLASDLSRADTPEKKTKIESELWKVDAEVLWNLRKMDMYGYMVSASGGMGVPKETVRLLTKSRGKRK